MSQEIPVVPFDFKEQLKVVKKQRKDSEEFLIQLEAPMEPKVKGRIKVSREYRDQRRKAFMEKMKIQNLDKRITKLERQVKEQEEG